MTEFRLLHLWLWLLTVRYSSQIVLTSIGNKCITNTSQAMSWIYDLSDVSDFKEKGASTFVPPVRNSLNFTCMKCLHNWRVTNSIDLNRVPNLVTDYRWEAFPGFVTIQVDSNGEKLNYSKFVQINSVDFSIPFSLRLKYEAHIFLCETQSVANSKCYWFLIDAWDGTAKGSRECHAQEISDTHGKSAQRTCLSSTNKTDNSGSGPAYLNNSIWIHMKLIKSRNEYRLMRDNKTVLQLEPQTVKFQPRYMMIHSKRVNGTWKLHDFMYWYSEYSSEELAEWHLSLTNQMKRHVCLSMFVVMCECCSLNIIVTDMDHQKLYESTVVTKDGLWKEHKFSVRFPGEINGHVLFKQIVEENCRLQFWAFSHQFRICETNEVRVLTTDSAEPECILVGSNVAIKRNQAKSSVLNRGLNCAETEFGEDCLKCSAIFDGPCPRNHQYCQLDDYRAKAKCYCTIGSKGSNCKVNCPSSNFGHACLQNCSNCQDGCSKDPISGTCETELCMDNYSGPKCDVPAGIFLFEELDTKPSYRSCFVTLKSTRGKGSPPQFYRFQYKKKTELVWGETEEMPFKKRDVPYTNLTHLDINTSYEVRIIGYSKISDLNDMKQMQHNIKWYACATKCKDIEASDIEIQPNSHDAVFAVKLKNDISCPESTYIFSVDGTEILDRCVRNLNPYTKYNLEIRWKSNNTVLRLISFRTKESEPGPVDGVSYVLTEDPAKVRLKWNSPKDPNGIINSYTVSYRVSRYLACQLNETNANKTKLVIDANQTQIELILIPYSLYSVEIVANTSMGHGRPVQTEFETKPSDYISPGEIQFKKLIVVKESVTLVYGFDSCNLVRGPFSAKLRITGTSSWCLGSTDINYKDTKVFSYSKLTPYCNYTYRMEIYRHNISVNITDNGSFQTKATVPLKPSEFDVFSKGKTYVDLRWKPPYPPNGEIDYYYLKGWYSMNSIASDVRGNNLKKCKLWPEYYCYRLEQLWKSYSYTFELKAKNKNVDGYSAAATLSNVVTKEEAPESPYGLGVKWSEDNVMNVSWYHPNRTYGRLTEFCIYVNGKTYTHKIPSEKYYNITYYEEIRDIENLPRRLNVQIKALNSAGDSPPLTQWNIDSPPPVPNFSTEASIVNGSILIKLQKDIREAKVYERFLYILIVKYEKDVKNILLSARDRIMEHFRDDSQDLISSINSWKIVKSFNISQDNFNSSLLDTVRIEQQEINELITSSDLYNISLIWLYKNKRYIRTQVEYINATAKRDGDSPLAAIFSVLLALVILIGIITASWWYFIRHLKLNFHQNPQSSFISLVPLYTNQPTPDRTTKPKMKKLDPIVPGHPLFKTEHSRLVRLEDFSSYVKESVKNDELRRQHELFPRGVVKPCTYGSLPENKMKNRYNNLTAYDATRVVLEKLTEDPYSDYINANYIDGYKMPNAYIATQGPKKQTVYDFWRMIWQEKVSWIVIVANVIEGGKKKTEQYWPNADDQLNVGDFNIAHEISELHAGYEFRNFSITKENGEKRKIGQLHFMAWPDHGVPLYPQTLVPFLQKMLTLRSVNSPIVVHCSAGVGRTGTIILCDICLHMAAVTGTIDVLSMLEHLRNQRPNMVDNVEQYKLAHLVVLNCLEGMRTSIPINKQFCQEVERILDVAAVESQMKYMRECEWQDDSMKTIFLDQNSEGTTFPEKDRFPNISPERHSQVYLYPFPPGSPTESSIYINAIHVDGYGEQGRYIVTSYPLPHCIGDFWRLIIEKNIYVVVCLNEISSKDQTCKPFWPKNKTIMRPTDFITVQHVKTSSLRFYTVMTFEIKTEPPYMEEEKSMTVEIIKFKGWSTSVDLPDFEDFISLTEDVIRISRKSTPALISCYDGATASGLFIAMSFLIEKINLEQECDVCQAIRSIRTNRKQFTDTLEQVEFLYKACLLYVEQKFAQYSNMEF